MQQVTADGLNFRLSEEHRLLLEAVHDAIKRLEPKRREFMRVIFEERRFPEELWQVMAEVGILGAIVPEEYGGTGLGLLAMVLALEAFSAAGLANTMAVLTTMDTMAILRGGTEEQKRKWLPRIADGSLKFAFAITEPDSGTNSFRIRTLARREGDVYRLNGHKAWITAADVADYILVVARTVPYDEVVRQGLPKAYGMGLFLVDRRAPGVSLKPMNTMGIEGYQQFNVYLDDVEVPADHRIGDEHLGAQVLFMALNPERILAAAIAVGMSEYALRKAVAYANERRVFRDTPIGAYQGVQHPLAQIKIKQEAARLLTYRAAWAFDQGLPIQEVGAYANMAKYMASELAVEAVDRAIQTHGGNGFVVEYGLIPLWAPARLLKTAPINNEMILNYVAEHVLGLPRSY